MGRKSDDISNLEKWIIFISNVLISLFSLGLMGYLKSKFSGQTWYISVLFTIIIGILAAGSGIIVAVLLEFLLNIKI